MVIVVKQYIRQLVLNTKFVSSVNPSNGYGATTYVYIKEISKSVVQLYKCRKNQLHSTLQICPKYS
jgi:hypothetical protein